MMFSLNEMAENFNMMDNSKPDLLEQLKAELDPIVEEIEKQSIKLVHCIEKGVHLVGDTFPHKVTIKASGFRWKPRMKVWGITNTVGKPLNKNLLINYQHKLKLKGLEVAIEITKEDSQAEIKKHLELKAERLEEKVEAYEQASNHYYQKRKAIGDRIPFGQPILVGHHSEGRMRRDARAIHKNMEKCVHFSEKAETAKRRLKSVESKLAPSQPSELNEDARKQLDQFIKGCKKSYALLRSVRTSKSKHCHSWIIAFHNSKLTTFRVELLSDRIQLSDYNWSNREEVINVDEAEKHIILRLEDANNKHDPIVINSDIHRFHCDYDKFYIRVFDEKREFYLRHSNAKLDNRSISGTARLKVYAWANEHCTERMLQAITPTTDTSKLVGWFERELKEVLGHACVFHTCSRH